MSGEKQTTEGKKQTTTTTTLNQRRSDVTKRRVYTVFFKRPVGGDVRGILLQLDWKEPTLVHVRGHLGPFSREDFEQAEFETTRTFVVSAGL